MTDRTESAADIAAAQGSTAAAPTDNVAAPDIGGLSGVLSAREAAVALGVSERTVRRAIQRGEIAATKHAGSFQITPAAIDDFRRRETGQSMLSHAAPPDRGAAAPDVLTSHAAAADTGQSAGGAVAVLRELLAEERRKSDSLLEASLVWQGRALQLEERLKALEAGPIAGDVEDAPRAHESGPQRGAVATEAPDTTWPGWRRWWRRVTGHAEK